MVSEITVVLRDSEKSLRTKHLVYDAYTVDENDPKIKECIDQTRKQFDGDPDSVKVRISLNL